MVSRNFIPPIWSSLNPYWAANCNLVLGVGCSSWSSITNDVWVLGFLVSTKLDGSLLEAIVRFNGAGIFDCVWGSCCWATKLLLEFDLFSSLNNINMELTLC